MTSAEQFFLNQIERGLKLQGRPALSADEKNYLTTPANEPLSIKALIDSVGGPRSKEITQMCVKALEASYADDQKPSSIEFRKKYKIAQDPVITWSEFNKELYSYCECGAISHAVQEWYLTVGREQQKSASKAAMGCLIFIVPLIGMFSVCLR